MKDPLQERVDKVATKAYEMQKKWQADRKELLEEARQCIDALDRDKVDNLDSNFVRKLFNYPSDITFIRFHKVFKKINVKKMKVEGIIERL